MPNIDARKIINQVSFLTSCVVVKMQMALS
ncbi:uncharacterized protein METZ01_LOCUS63881 [marine metagenome]|uniref:Uncharacterized protein n=1 Tax=marine metagenome TaxID=408172 RepID=A0A381T8K4_9ZZZZ